MRVFTTLLLSILASSAFAEPVAHLDKAFLYLPNAEMERRLVDPNEFVNYAGLIQDALEPTFSSLPKAEPVSFGLIVTIRAGNESKVWFSTQSGELSPEQREQIAASIEAIPVPEVSRGVVPIAFALRVWGAEEVVNDIPVAPEWADFADGSPAVDVIEKAWK